MTEHARTADGNDGTARAERSTVVDPSVDDPAAVTMTAHAQRPVPGAEWMTSGRLRLRREIRVETRSVEVQVRREVLTVEYDDSFAPRPDGVVPEPADAPDLRRDAVTLVLREEIPRVTLETVPYEMVTARVHRVVTAQQVGSRLAREQIVLETAAPTRDVDPDPR